MTREITQLAARFSPTVIRKAPGGHGTYVSHYLVEQRIIAVLGFPPSTSILREIRGPFKDLGDVVTGVVLRMEAVVDGRPWFAEEIGEVEHPGNHDTDGARAKDAASDGYKRCAMRLGVALHVWFGDEQDWYTLPSILKKQDGDEVKAEAKETWPISREEVEVRLEAMFAKGGASAPADEAADLVKAMSVPALLSAREWAAVANAAQDVIDAYKVAS